MLYLTDRPDATGPLLPRGCDWEPVTARSTDDAYAAMHHALGLPADAWRCEVAVGGHERAIQASGPVHAVLIDHAEDSQFDVIARALQADMRVPDRLVCLALRGTGFHGQRGRPWVALPGNLHLTMHYRVDVPAVFAAALTMLPAVAAAAAISDLSGQRPGPRIKWVNDITIDGRKVCGVLTSTHVEDDRICHVLFGIGMNLSRPPALPPSPIAPPAAALSEFIPGGADRLPQAFNTLVRRIDTELARLLQQGPDPLYHAYRALAAFIGRAVRIWPDAGPDGPAAAPIAAGRVLDLHQDLSLCIEGIAEPVRRGRMQLLEELRVEN